MIDWINYKGEKIYVEYKRSEYIPSTYYNPPEFSEIEIISVSDIEFNEIDITPDEEHEIIDILNYGL